MESSDVIAIGEGSPPPVDAFPTPSSLSLPRRPAPSQDGGDQPIHLTRGAFSSPPPPPPPSLTFSTPPTITPPPPSLTPSTPPPSQPSSSPLQGLSSTPIASTGRTAGTLHSHQIQLLNSLLIQQEQQSRVNATAEPAVGPGGGATRKGPSSSSVRVVGGAEGRVVMTKVVKPSEEQEEISKMAKEGVQQAMSEEVFSTYTNQNPVFANARPHPASIVEAASLADVPLPPASYDLSSSIPQSVIESGQLSSLQLEGILYASQRHLTLLPSGCRAGFFIGDGAGVGKGRQIAGIILDNYARGRCKHIWFSVSHDLKMDAERDLRDIGTYIKVIDGCQQLDKETKVLGLPADFKEGVVFSTYATLVSTVQRGGQSRSRLQQLVDWCGGPSFQGCLIFDECHKAKNFIPGKEQKSTKVSLAVTTVQRMLPSARVVYCSATGVSDVKNLAFMERLGLWGEGMSYRNFEDFLEGITRRGLGAAEMIAMEMKSAGMYVSRGLSFRDAEFTSLEVTLSNEQVQVYDTAAHVWNELRRSLSFALSRVGAPNHRVWSTFWGAHQRFFKQLCMSMKVPVIVAETKKALEDGFCVVIGLQTTGESSLESELLKNDGELSDFVSLTREILSRFISDHFPIVVHQQQQQGVPISDLWCVTAKDMLLEFVSKMNLPNSPLDDIIDQLGGVECVAEMTGRRGRMVRGRGGRVQYELRDSGSNTLESLNNRERAFFMEGKKLVAIISDAASTGISLHSDLGAANLLRRMHITMELPWSADKAVQQLGRSHRAHQSSGPLYKLVTTNLGGERRFAAAVAKRLQTLGALTKGDRRAATGVEFSEVNFDNQYGRSALRQMYSTITKRELYVGVDLHSVSQLAGLSEDLTQDRLFLMLQEGLELMDVVEGGAVKEGEGVGRFLNRILGLRVQQQNLLFAYFCECVSLVISAAKREGRFNEGVTDIMAQSIRMVGSPQEVFREYKLSHVPTIHTHVVADRGVSWENALALAEGLKVSGSGFYRSRREQYHRHLYLLALPKEGSSLLYNIIRPNTGRSFYEENKHDLLQKYTAITTEQAECGWREQYDSTKERCIHGSACKNIGTCLIGSRLTHIHLLSGGILPLMSLLESTLLRNAASLDLSKVERSLRVVRVRLDDGRRLIGIRYPYQLISEIAGVLKAIHLAQQTQKSENLPQLPTAAKDLTVEKETTVNQRALAKALTPPVTLLKFFKPKAQSEHSSDGVPMDTPSSSAHKREDSPLSSAHKREKPNAPELLKHQDPLDVGGVKSKTVMNSGGSGAPKPHKSSLGVSRKVKPLQMKLAHSFARIPPPTTREDPIVVDDDSGPNGGTVRKKRKSEDTVGEAPILKALKRRSERVVVTCPVCGKEFTDASNVDLNKHLDGCLLSNQS